MSLFCGCQGFGPFNLILQNIEISLGRRILVPRPSRYSLAQNIPGRDDLDNHHRPMTSPCYTQRLSALLFFQ